MSSQEFEINLTPSERGSDSIDPADAIYYQNNGTLNIDSSSNPSLALTPRMEFERAVRAIESCGEVLLIRSAIPKLELLGGFLIGHNCEVSRYTSQKKLNSTVEYIKKQMSSTDDREALPPLTADEVMETVLRRHMLFALKDAPQPNYDSSEIPDPSAVFGMMVYAVPNLSLFGSQYPPHPRMILAGMSMQPRDEFPNWQSIVELPRWMSFALECYKAQTLVMPDNQKHYQFYTGDLPIQCMEPMTIELILGGNKTDISFDIQNTAKY